MSELKNLNEEVMNVNLSISKEVFGLFQDFVNRNLPHINSFKAKESVKENKEFDSNFLIIDLRNRSEDAKYRHLVCVKETKEYFLTDNLEFAFSNLILSDVAKYEHSSEYKIFNFTDKVRSFRTMFSFLTASYNPYEYRVRGLKIHSKLYEDEKVKVFRTSYTEPSLEKVSDCINDVLRKISEEDRTIILKNFVSRWCYEGDKYLKEIKIAEEFYPMIMDSIFKLSKTFDSDPVDAASLINIYMELFVINETSELDNLYNIKDSLLENINNLITTEKLKIDKLIESVANDSGRRLYIKSDLWTASKCLEISKKVINFFYDIDYFDKETYEAAFFCNEFLSNQILNLEEVNIKDTRVKNMHINSAIIYYLKLIWLCDSYVYKFDSSKISSYPKTTRWMFSIIDSESSKNLLYNNLDDELRENMMKLLRFRMNKNNNSRTLQSIINNTTSISPLFLDYLKYYFIPELIPSIKDKKRRDNLLNFIVNQNYCSLFNSYDNIAEDDYRLYKYTSLTLTTDDLIALYPNNKDLFNASVKNTMKRNLSN